MNFSKLKKLSTLDVAQKLLGSHLIVNLGGETLVGRIVETEAYLEDDPAAHSFKGLTPRTKPMFGPPGFSYVYLIYGMYYCFNVVTNVEGIGEAVLIRALEPLTGIETMKRRRKQNSITALCSGPGKLCSALGINKQHNGIDLQSGIIQIEPKVLSKNEKIVVSRRIGITVGAELEYGFSLKDNGFVSMHK